MKLPLGTWDTHCHIFPAGYPTVHGDAPPEGSLEGYRALCGRLGIDRPVFVQANAYGLDNSALLRAMADWGPDARGVAAIGRDTPERELARLHTAGVRGARIMELHGGAVPLTDLPAVAERVRPFGWTPIVQFDGSRIVEHERMLAAVPGPWVLDHFGKFLDVPATTAHLDAIRRLMDGGAHVKFSAAYEFSTAGPPDYEDVATIAHALAAHRPDRIMWASNWPHVRNAVGDKPDDVALAGTVASWIPEAHHHDVFVATPRRLFG